MPGVDFDIGEGVYSLFPSSSFDGLYWSREAQAVMAQIINVWLMINNTLIYSSLNTWDPGRLR